MNTRRVLAPAALAAAAAIIAALVATVYVNRPKMLERNR